MSDDAQAEARGLEVRLLRRLPALAARLRGRAARARRRGRDRELPRGVERDGRRGPYDLSLVEGSITTPHDAERIQQVRRAVEARSSRSAPARPPAASRRCATSPTSTSSSSAVYASPEYISTLATSTPIAAHVPVDFELRGCPIDKRQLLEVITRLPARAQAGHPDDSVCIECKRARHRLRDGRARHTVPRPGHPRGLRRALPGLQPRLLRLLRPDGDAEHRLADAACCASSGWTSATSSASSAPSTSSRRGVRARVAERA